MNQNVKWKVLRKLFAVLILSYSSQDFCKLCHYYSEIQARYLMSEN